MKIEINPIDQVNSCAMNLLLFDTVLLQFTDGAKWRSDYQAHEVAHAHSHAMYLL